MVDFFDYKFRKHAHIFRLPTFTTASEAVESRRGSSYESTDGGSDGAIVAMRTLAPPATVERRQRWVGFEHISDAYSDTRRNMDSVHTFIR